MAKERVILSLDYDGHASVLFKDDTDNAYKKFLTPTLDSGEANPKYVSYLADLLEGCRLAFEDYFATIGASSNPTSLYVGSNRQSQEIDRANILKNRNGSCFVNYTALASEKGWALKKLLYADLHNNSGVTYAPGTEFDNPESTLETTFDETKVEMIRAQLDEVSRDYPDETVHFYFSDDDIKDTILPALHDAFGDKYHNIHLHYIKFDWFIVHERQAKDLKEKVSGAESRGVEAFRAMARECILAPYESALTVTAKLEPVAAASILPGLSFFNQSGLPRPYFPSLRLTGIHGACVLGMFPPVKQVASAATSADCSEDDATPSYLDLD